MRHMRIDIPVDLAMVEAFVAEKTFSLIKTNVFSNNFCSTMYCPVGKITLDDHEETLFRKSIETHKDLFMNSGMSGCSGVVGSDKIEVRLLEALSNSTTLRVLLSKIKKEYLENKGTLWYICDEPLVTNFSMDILRSDFIKEIVDFYK